MEDHGVWLGAVHESGARGFRLCSVWACVSVCVWWWRGVRNVNVCLDKTNYRPLRGRQSETGQITLDNSPEPSASHKHH